MLIAFSVENYCSFKNRQTLSLEATSDEALESSHVLSADGIRILKSVAIYGPNASGKSNLVEAMRAMRLFVLSSAKEGQVLDQIDVEPFLLHDDTLSAPSKFEWDFCLQDARYRYGFVVDSQKVHTEWLMRRRGKAKEATLFTRAEQKIRSNPKHFPEGEERKGFARPNALFLSVCAQLNGPVAGIILAWFNQLRFIAGADPGLLFTARQLQVEEERQKLLEFAQRADLSISGLSSEITEANQVVTVEASATEKSGEPPTESRKTRKVFLPEIKTQHPRYGRDGKQSGTVEFNLKRQESQGTRKFIALSGPLHHTVSQGSTLVLDEFEARLHPMLSREVFRWFHSPANRSRAQLVVATHDIGLMEPEVLRRDQVWFCDKDGKGATSLYSLAEFDSTKVRPTTRFSRHYMQGLLGAVPKLALVKESGSE